MKINSGNTYEINKEMFLLHLNPFFSYFVFHYLCFPTGFRHGDLCQVCLLCHGCCWLWERPQFSVA